MNSGFLLRPIAIAISPPNSSKMRSQSICPSLMTLESNKTLRIEKRKYLNPQKKIIVEIQFHGHVDIKIKRVCEQNLESMGVSNGKQAVKVQKTRRPSTRKAVY